MARKARAGGVSKSDLIRKTFADNPTAGPTEVAKLIQDSQNVKVSPAMVSTVLSQDRNRGGKPAKRGRPKKDASAAASSTPSAAPAKASPGRPAAAAKPSADVSISTLIRVKKLSEELGGIEQAKAALDALSRILG